MLLLHYNNAIWCGHKYVAYDTRSRLLYVSMCLRVFTKSVPSLQSEIHTLGINPMNSTRAVYRSNQVNNNIDKSAPRPAIYTIKNATTTAIKCPTYFGL